MSADKDKSTRVWSALAGVIVGGWLFSMTNISCGTVEPACADSCPGLAMLQTEVDELKATVAMLQTSLTTLQTQLNTLDASVVQAKQIQALSCTQDQGLRWNGSAWECVTLAKPVWLAQISRDATNTIFYRRPGAAEVTINIGAGTADVTGNTHIHYKYNAGTSDAILSFNLEGAPSVRCTLLHYDDDNLRPGHYFSTDTGGQSASIWGNTTTKTFRLAREGVTTGALASNESHAIACFEP